MDSKGKGNEAPIDLVGVGARPATPPQRGVHDQPSC